MYRRWTLSSLALGSLLASGCGGRLFHRRCDSRDPYPPRPRTGSTDAPSGVIPPRDFDPIPPSSLPTTPAGPRAFDPADPSRAAFSAPLPTPRLQDPPAPRLPPAFVPNSPTDLPHPDDLPAPVEARKFVESKPVVPKAAEPESPGPRKLLLAPDDVTDSPRSKAGYTPKTENGLPLPDRTVLLDPVAPADPADPTPAAKPEPTESLKVPLPMPAAEPRTSQTPPTTPPTDLDEFKTVTGLDGVASGRKPGLEGLVWLQKNGYRTVVYLHDPKYDAGPAADLCRQKGLKFVGIPVAADRVKEAVEKFDAALAAPDARPLYVCDDTGRAAGAVWYAHFRGTRQLSPDTARVRAGELGLRDPAADADQKPLWDAVQEYLGKR